MMPLGVARGCSLHPLLLDVSDVSVKWYFINDFIPNIFFGLFTSCVRTRSYGGFAARTSQVGMSDALFGCVRFCSFCVADTEEIVICLRL